eukprot:TRINITY_DN65763_c0_g1_i1.p1 TRINITY_DN65763_c0_g1~~TRINITY_DN65763_c0_g1_i1.p1  ORF type:complete len:661 (-),score=115.49 TRINITY_DN65763_c0_g1_i1:22-2004(-)
MPSAGDLEFVRSVSEDWKAKSERGSELLRASQQRVSASGWCIKTPVWSSLKKNGLLSASRDTLSVSEHVDSIRPLKTSSEAGWIKEVAQRLAERSREDEEQALRRHEAFLVDSMAKRATLEQNQSEISRDEILTRQLQDPHELAAILEASGVGHCRGLVYALRLGMPVTVRNPRDGNYRKMILKLEHFGILLSMTHNGLGGCKLLLSDVTEIVTGLEAWNMFLELQVRRPPSWQRQPAADNVTLVNFSNVERLPTSKDFIVFVAQPELNLGARLSAAKELAMQKAGGVLSTVRYLQAWFRSRPMRVELRRKWGEKGADPGIISQVKAKNASGAVLSSALSFELEVSIRRYVSGDIQKYVANVPKNLRPHSVAVIAETIAANVMSEDPDTPDIMAIAQDLCDIADLRKWFESLQLEVLGDAQRFLTGAESVPVAQPQGTSKDLLEQVADSIQFLHGELERESVLPAALVLKHRLELEEQFTKLQVQAQNRGVIEPQYDCLRCGNDGPRGPRASSTSDRPSVRTADADAAPVWEDIQEDPGSRRGSFPSLSGVANMFSGADDAMQDAVRTQSTQSIPTLYDQLAYAALLEDEGKEPGQSPHLLNRIAAEATASLWPWARSSTPKEDAESEVENGVSRRRSRLSWTQDRAEQRKQWFFEGLLW